MVTKAKLARAKLAIEGLAMGDAYGNHHGNNPRKHGTPVWEYSDDTLMALSIVENLRKHSEINQDELAQSFARHWDGQRGYGRGATQLLKRIQRGINWQRAVRETFDEQGSFGNGAAMRVAPIGAYFADDLDTVIHQAELSAVVTHTHIEGIAGAIAVAVAAAIAYHYSQSNVSPDWKTFLSETALHVPASEVHDKIQLALELDGSTQEAAKLLGNGRPSIAQMTIPFALWSASRFLNDYEKAVRQTASVQGDVDTNCAIVGGIVALYTGLEGIPQSWLERREALPRWAFEDEK